MSLKIPAEFTGLEKSAEIAAKKAGRNLKINLGTSARSVEALAQPLGRITGKADEFTKSMEAANARVLAFGASVGVLTAVTQAFKDIVTVTIQVEKQMASINAILGASTGELSKFKKEIFDVARNTEQSFDTVATAALELSRQGLSATEVVNRLNDSLILSRLSGQSAADAVAGLTSAINGFKKAGITSEQVVNKFSEAAKSAAVSERDLAEAFKRAGAVAGQAGVSFDELVGIVSAVQEKTSRGGAVIGNSFKTIFTRIQSLDKLKTMQELGVQVTDTTGQILSATDIIKNLAGVLENFPDARRLQIAENLVGKFQVAPFISILEDYNDETSKAIKITEISGKATTAAYERNEALNKTLSAAINEVTVNLSQLGDMLGKIGVTDSLKNVLGFFNSMVEGLKGLLDEETGSSIAKGLVKGIGNVISGPGLAIFAAVIGKLTLDLVKFGTGSLKTFFGINRAAKEQATLQGQIASTLLNNSGIQKEILRIENSQVSAEEKKAQQTKFFTTALNEQFAIMQKMQGIAARVAPGVRAGTGRGAFGRGAGGYVPNFAGGSVVGSEQADINRGVGGAPPSARPVAIPNFNFGGGQRGTMVANTSEFIVPNFGGGSAIFNQNMAASMGLPPGAKRVGAARGYIPNFAIKGQFLGSRDFTDINNREIKRSFFFKGNEAKTDKVRDTLNYKGPDKDIIAARDKLIAMRGANQVFKSSMGKGGPGGKGPYVMLVPQTGVKSVFTQNFTKPRGPFKSFRGRAYGIKPNLEDKLNKFTNLENEIDQSLADAANQVVNFLSDDINLQPSPVTAGNLDSLISSEGGPGAIGALKGAMFESILNAVIDASKFDSPASKKRRGNLDIDFLPNRDLLEQIFGLPKNKFMLGDYKSSMKSKGRYVDQVMVNDGAFVPPKKGKAAGGYIPNFVGALENAIGREAAAGIPINQIRVNQKGTLRNSKNPMGLAVTNTRDEPTGAIPNFFSATTGNLSDDLKRSTKDNIDSNKQVATANRDMLGTIFAVQMGMSLLTGATSDAEQGIGRFVNRLAEGLSTATTGALAGSALASFGDTFKDSESKFKVGFGKVIGGLGALSVAVGVGVGAFKALSNIIDDATGKTDLNKDAMAFLADAARDAAFSLQDLSESQKRGIDKEAGEFIGTLKDNKTLRALGADQIDFDMLDEETLDNIFRRLRTQGVAQEDIRKMVLGAGNLVNTRGDELDVSANVLGFGEKEVDELLKSVDLRIKNIRDARLKLQDLPESELIKLTGAKGLSSLQEASADIVKSLRAAGVTDDDRLGKFQEDVLKQINKFQEGAAKKRQEDIKLLGASGTKSVIEGALGTARLRAAGLSRAEKDKQLIGANLKDPSGLLGVERAINAQNFAEGATVAMLESLPKMIEKMGDVVINDSGLKEVVGEILGGKIRIEDLDKDKLVELSKRIATASGGLLPGQAKDIETILKAEENTLKIRLQSANAAAKIADELKKQNVATLALQERNKARATLIGGGLDFKAATALTPFDRFRALAEKERVTKISQTMDPEAQRQALLTENLQNTLISASETFAQNISDGLVDAIIQGKSLKDTLVSAATDFFTMMSKAYMQQAVNNIVGGGGGTGFLSTLFGIGGISKAATGGMISGGSGTRDDVPALLTGGEFVMRKSAVQKYGSNFMSSLNQGSVPKFANGGMFIPGTYGQGAISGKQNLLNFATQTGTSGAFDRFGGGAGFASISLAPESLSLTNLGRSLSPAFKRTQAAKSDAFGLYVQQLNADEQRKEQEKQLAQAKKERRKGLFASLALAGLFAGVKGIMAGRKSVGGLLNVKSLNTASAGRSASELPPGLISAAPRALSVAPKATAVAPKALPVAGLFQSFKGQGMGGQTILPKMFQGFDPQPIPTFDRNPFAPFSSSPASSSSNFMSRLLGINSLTDQTAPNIFGGPQIKSPLGEVQFVEPPLPVGPGSLSNALFPTARPMGGMIPYMAGGGGVPYAAGVDTVPAMLSGGEFVMNAGATQRIGAGNLEALNAGGNVGGGSSTSITKGDTNISIVVNSDGGERENNSGSADQQDQNLAAKLKDAVRDVLSQEKRLGGMLRV